MAVKTLTEILAQAKERDAKRGTSSSLAGGVTPSSKYESVIAQAKAKDAAKAKTVTLTPAPTLNLTGTSKETVNTDLRRNFRTNEQADAAKTQLENANLAVRSQGAKVQGLEDAYQYGAAEQAQKKLQDMTGQQQAAQTKADSLATEYATRQKSIEKAKLGLVQDNADYKEAVAAGSTSSENKLSAAASPSYQLATAIGGGRDARSKYQYATQEEKDTYAYYIGSGQKDKADRYLSLLEDDLAQREGQTWGEGILAQDNAAVRNLGTTALGAIEGTNRFVTGARQLGSRLTGNAEPVSRDSTEYAQQLVRPQLTGAAGVASDVASSIGFMVPSLAASALTGSAGLGAVLMGAATAGDTYNQERRAGKGDKEATIYATAIGAMEGGLQYVLGGIDALGKGGASKLLANTAAGRAAVTKVDDVLKLLAKSPEAQKALEAAAKAGKFALSMNDEGFEEYLQNIIQPVIRNVVFDENNEVKVFSEDNLYAYLLGALTAGGINAVSAAASYSGTAKKAGTPELVAPELGVNVETKQIKAPTIAAEAQTVIPSATEMDKIPTRATYTYSYKPDTSSINQKTWYHGSGTEGLTEKNIDIGATKIEGLLGQGVYLTDNPDIADGYARTRSKRSNTPTTYEVKVNVENALDLSEPMPDDVYKAFEDIIDYYVKEYGYEDKAQEIKDLQARRAPGVDIYRAFSDFLGDVSHGELIPKSEFYDDFSGLSSKIIDLGYDAYTHEGGKYVGKTPHQVLVVLDPRGSYGGYSKGKNITSFTQRAPISHAASVSTGAAQGGNSGGAQTLSAPIIAPKVESVNTETNKKKSLSASDAVLQPQTATSETGSEKTSSVDSISAAAEKVNTGKVLPGQIDYLIDPNFKETTSALKETGRKAYQYLVSAQAPLERIKSKAVTAAIQMARQAGGTVDYIAQKALVGRNGNELGESYVKLIQEIPEAKLDEFNDYSQHLHNISRMTLQERYGIDNKPVMGAGTDATGKTVAMSAQESRETVAQMDRQNPEFRKIAEDIQTWWNTFGEEWLVGSGMVSQEAYDKMREMYPYYIPTFRTERQGGGSGMWGKSISTPKVVKSAKGGFSEIVPLEEAFMQQINRTVRATRRNELGQEILLYARENPSDAALHGVKLSVESGGEPGIPDIDGFIDDADERTLKELGKGEYRLTVYENGQKVNLDITQDVWYALKALQDKGISDDGIAALVKAGRNITGWSKSAITGMSALFAVTNTIRDVQTYGVNSISMNPAQLTSNYLKAVWDTVTNSDVYKQYQALGGARSGFYGQQEGFMKSAEKLRPFSQQTAKQKAGTVLSAPFRAMGALGQFTEQLPRLAEYRNALDTYGDSDASRRIAAEAAADVTVNFSRNAPVTKVADAFVLYLNAQVQGIDKMARQLKDRPAVTLGKAAATVLLPSILLFLINRDNPYYDELDNRTKDAYYIIPNLLDLDENGDAKTFFKLPRSREYGVVMGASLDRIAKFLETRDAKESFKGYGSSLADSFLPTDVTTGSYFAPIAINIPNNKDWAGRSIVPANLENLEPRYQSDINTSGVAKNLGEALNISPKQIDYLIDSYAGYPGDLLQGLTSPQNKGKDALETARNALQRAIVQPFQRRFTADPRYQSAVTDALYDLRDEYTTKSATRNYTESLDSSIQTPEERVKSYIGTQTDALALLRTQEKDMLGRAGSIAEKEAQSKAIREQENDIARQAGKMEKTYYDALVKAYGSVPKSSDLKAYNQALQDAYLKVDREIFGSEYAIRKISTDALEEAQELKQQGVSYDEYFNYRMATRRASEGEDRVTTAQKLDYIADSGLNDTKKAALVSTVYNGSLLPDLASAPKLMSVYADTGDTGVINMIVPESFSQDKTVYDLSDDEMDLFAETYVSAFEKSLKSLDYIKDPDDAAEYIKRKKEAAYQAAKQAVIRSR